MRMWLGLTIGTALISLFALPDLVLAQQKTVKACQDEWRANRSENQAKGMTEKAYVAQCRAGGAAVQPANAPAAKRAPAPSASTTPASGQKTVKACQDEWRANRAAYQAAKVTQKAYVDKCRAGESVALPSTPASSPPPASTTTAPAPSTAPAAAQKTVKACQDEWRANRAAYQAAKVTQRVYVEKCRTGESIALPAGSAPAPTPSATTAAPAPSPAPTTASPPPARSTATTSPAQAGAGQFQAEAQAKAHCPSDLVVWVNRPSKVYHFAGYKNYGTTKDGAYMCEKEATTQGFRASKTEKRPST